VGLGEEATIDPKGLCGYEVGLIAREEDHGAANVDGKSDTA
jgi:hypothetical protein